jgi:hypothetical protein
MSAAHVGRPATGPHVKTAAAETAAEMGMTATAAARKMSAAAMTATAMAAGPLSGCKRGRRKSGGRYDGKRHGLDLPVHDKSLKASVALKETPMAAPCSKRPYGFA